MKAVFQTILGLIIDDWWLAIGLLISITVTSVLVNQRFDASSGGWLLLLLILVTLILSLTMEYRKKTRKA
jgi:hypothetical protein